MKISIIYASLALLGATVSAQEACVEGKRVMISPGYTVEYRCNQYRLGTTYNNIRSHESCALKCQDDERAVCTYNAAKKMCIVGAEGGKEGRSEGATYMVRVPEEEDDPFAEDPFQQTCEEARDACFEVETALRQDLSRCQDKLAAALSGEGTTPPPTTPPVCGVAKWGKNSYSTKRGMNLANCKKACDADARCLSYSANKGTTGDINCYLYEDVTNDVPDGSWPNFVQYDKACA